MTDTSSLAITHATTDSYPVHAHRGSPAAVDGAASDSGAPDEEPYTIKCICSFEEDDGNTVFCEGCETWQHILCYYPDKRVPDVHNCVECEPRPLDNRRAHERQRQRRLREKSEDGDRKPKRSGAKTHKRKSKDSDVTEYTLGRHDSSAREPPPVKKQKASRRPSTSTGGVSASSGPFAESRNRRSSTSVAMSPTSISSPSIPQFSDEFLSLYDREDLFVESKTVLNYGVDFVNEIVAWLKDPQILAKVSDGLNAEEFGKKSEDAMDQSHWPSLKVETIPASSVEIDGKVPVHKILKTQDSIPKGNVVGEIFGQLGHVKDYKKLPSNRWEEFGHAMPFVYFNRQLDLYIDSRQEGNELRHIRRSCVPNVLFKIYITSGRQYHFCFVAKEDIPANSEITFMWHFDEAFFPGKSPVIESSKDRPIDANEAAIHISNTLANFGGCACGNPQTCLVDKLDRRSKLPVQKRAKSKVKGKTRRTKSQVDINRADSETVKNPDDHDSALDTRSNSGSTRDRHTGSRDLSPTAHQEILPELSSRERRKIANVEKQFEQMAQGPVNSKRRKRMSGLPRSKTGTISSSTHTEVDFKPYNESGPSRVSRIAEQSAHRRAVYLDSQTELCAGDVERAFLRAEHTKRGYELDILHDTAMKVARFSAGNHSREDWAQREAWEAGDHSVIPSGVIPWWCIYYPEPTDGRSHIDLLPEDADRMGIPRDHGPLAMPLRWSFHQSKYPRFPYKYRKKTPMLGIHYDPPGRLIQGDVDSQSAVSDKLSSFSAPSSDHRKSLAASYWPSIAAHSFRVVRVENRKSLHVSMPPPHIPSVLSPGSASTGSLASPGSHDTASPLALVPPPAPAPPSTPAKKKLSLGDYLIRRGTMATTPTSERPQAPAPTPASDPGSLGGQHFLAITTVFDENHAPSHSKAQAGGEKNDFSGSPDVAMTDAPDVPIDVAMEDVPESQSTNKPSIPS